MKDGFLRVACASPSIRVADCRWNGARIVECVEEAFKKGAKIVLFPELCITSYTCGDLFFQRVLLDAAEHTLWAIAEQTKKLSIVVVVGLPLQSGDNLYNCAAVLFEGVVLGFVPKSHLPNYGEFQELRYFSEGSSFSELLYRGQKVPLGTDLLFSCVEMPEFSFGIEICEDLWAAEQPSTDLAVSGALMILNPSASNEVVSKTAYRRELVRSQSARLTAAYLFASAGMDESTTDLVFAGRRLIAENGVLLNESEPFTTGLIYSDIDLARLRSERLRLNTFVSERKAWVISFHLTPVPLDLTRVFSKEPFVPSEPRMLEQRCEEVFMIQAAALRKRLAHMNCDRVVIGVSGGLDSTLALLVALHTFDWLQMDRKGILAVTMPCFGTTETTLENARSLIAQAGVDSLEIDIRDAVLKHFSDIGHEPNLQDVVYENAQSRERTQILMDLANQRKALFLGTGDLSELALGWTTYNGDHMSMYAINASVPKTLVRYLVQYASSKDSLCLKEVLQRIIETPVSPELLPPVNGEIVQQTERIVGPYLLHDFFLYYFLRFSYPPRKIFRVACLAFKGFFSKDEIRKTLILFLERFFSQQYKRSCVPDGPKIGSVSLSPRGDLRLPSDASVAEWISELQSL